MFLLMNISIMNRAASIQVFYETPWMVHVGYDFFHPRVKKIKLPRKAHDIWRETVIRQINVLYDSRRILGKHFTLESYWGLPSIEFR